MRRRYYSAGTGRIPRTFPGIPAQDWVADPDGTKNFYFGTFSKAEERSGDFKACKAIIDLGIEVLAGLNSLLEGLVQAHEANQSHRKSLD